MATEAPLPSSISQGYQPSILTHTSDIVSDPFSTYPTPNFSMHLLTPRRPPSPNHSLQIPHHGTRPLRIILK